MFANSDASVRIMTGPNEGSFVREHDEGAGPRMSRDEQQPNAQLAALLHDLRRRVFPPYPPSQGSDTGF
jgi:hypothetical protein